MDEHRGIELTVNGQAIVAEADSQTPLLSVLRNDLSLRGARQGCGIGECGVCTVLLDGAPVRSCSTPLETAAGRSVTTPEGLGTPDAPHPVQQTFLDEQAAQCGYCINGMIMTVAALREDPECTEDDLRRSLSEHLCRCGTHTRVLRAARRSLSGRPDERAVTVVDGAGTDDTRERPSLLDTYPDVESWLRLSADGRVEVRTGRVEIGQGIRAAMGQIAASQIGVPVDHVDVRPATTTETPDEGYTSGSKSIDNGGEAMATAGAACRRLLLERAASLLGEDAADLDIRDGAVVDAAGTARLTVNELAAHGPVTGTILPSDEPDWTRPPLGEPLPRTDLLPKLTGAPAFVHDLEPPGMVHARVLLPPSYDAVPVAIDTADVAAMPGVLDVVVDGRIVLVVAEHETQAIKAGARLGQQVLWEDPGLPFDDGPAPESFRALPSKPWVVAEPTGDEPEGAEVTASYRQPYQAHAPVAPSCAVAVVEDGVTKVWTHTQGVHPLRRELAALFDEDQDRIVAEHSDGPGCYGHNLADDAAVFACVAARAVPGRPVRFLFTLEQEFTWEPFGSALLADLSATLGDDGMVRSWEHRGLTDVHGNRPRGAGTGLILSWLREGGTWLPWRGPTEGGARNAAPPYAFARMGSVADHVQGPLRTSSLRSLASFLNVFATESFMDELAERAGADPVAFRSEHLDDQRFVRVLEAAAEGIGWQPHVGPSGRGIGIALSRYHDDKAIVAQAVEAAVDTDTGRVEVRRVVTACDAGTIINADGLANQIEGGTLQGLSRALHEQVVYDGRGIRTRDWTTYPVLRFDDVPPIRTILIDNPGAPPLGAGEASIPPIGAALANAIDDAIGVRLRNVPFTPEAIQARLLELTDEEAERVILD